jgi:uncharacterized coiled-coil DUF342 family protein
MTRMKKKQEKRSGKEEYSQLNETKQLMRQKQKQVKASRDKWNPKVQRWLVG